VGAEHCTSWLKTKECSRNEYTPAYMLQQQTTADKERKPSEKMNHVMENSQ